MVELLNETKIQEIAKSFGRKPWQQEKHYIQHIALMELTEQPLVFKGGTYLWLCHGLKRFSEDLDFTANGKIDSKNLIQKTSNTLQNYGVENKIKEIIDDEKSFSFRIQAKGPLSKNEKSDCYVYVEINKREEVLKKTESFELQNPYNLPTKVIAGMNLEEVAAEKIRTIMMRDKARDLFDEQFLAKKIITLETNLIEKKLNYYNKEFSKQKLEQKINQKKEYYYKELEQIVFEKIPNFEETKKAILNMIK